MLSYIDDDHASILESDQNGEHRRRSQENKLDPEQQQQQQQYQQQQELTRCGASVCCIPSSGLHRFIALMLMCTLGFGSFFCYDTPGALQEVLKDELDLSTSQFTLMYSIYSWPNVVLCFVGGFLIDRVFGIRLGAIIYLLVLLIGQLLFACGGILNAFWLMIVGRFIFGIGSESLAVAQNNYAVLWFKGKELNMVFGLQMSVARFGSTVNFWVMQPIYDYVSNFYHDYQAVGVALLLATTTCIFSFIGALILGWMDKRAERILQRNINPTGAIPRISDVVTFNISFWMITITCVAYYVAVFPFIALGKGFFMSRFHYTPAQANNVNSIMYLISAISSPLFGYIIDKAGKHVTWVFISTILTIGSHSLLAFTMVNPYVGMILMGLSYSLFGASMWPLIALIIPEYQLGTAYGFCQSVLNLGLAVITIVSGIIVDHSDNYDWLELFFLGWLAIALICTCVIWLHDRRTNGILNTTPAQHILYGNLTTDPRLTESNESLNSEIDYDSDEAPLLVTR